MTEFETGYLGDLGTEPLNVGNAQEQYSPPRFKLNRISNDFMESVTSALAISELILQIEGARERQSEIDTIYMKLCDTITQEIGSTKTRKRYKLNKPY